MKTLTDYAKYVLDEWSQDIQLVWAYWKTGNHYPLGRYNHVHPPVAQVLPKGAEVTVIYEDDSYPFAYEKYPFPMD